MFIQYPRLLLSGFFLFCFACFIFAFTSFDIPLSHFFILSPQDSILFIVKIISKTGSFVVITFLSCLLGIWLWFKKHIYDAIWVIFTMASCRLFFAFIKLVIHRHRPILPEPLTHAITASFPSGHATNSLAFLLLCYFIFNKRIPVLFFVIVWGIIIGWTRLALGAHWTSDVLAGWGCALMWLAFMLQLRSSVLFHNIVDHSLLSRFK